MRSLYFILFMFLLSPFAVNAQCVGGNSIVTCVNNPSNVGTGDIANPYVCGDQIAISVLIDTYSQANNNWLHGVFITDLPEEWSLVGGSAPSNSAWRLYRTEDYQPMVQLGPLAGTRSPGWYYDTNNDKILRITMAMIVQRVI